MIDKKLTRKEFLLSALAFATLFVVSKVPFMEKKVASSKEDNSYGNSSYGGSPKNA